MSTPAPEPAPSTKMSISMPESLVNFVDERCRAFRIGRSRYFQMLLEAERQFPRNTFVKVVYE